MTTSCYKSVSVVPELCRFHSKLIVVFRFSHLNFKFNLIVFDSRMPYGFLRKVTGSYESVRIRKSVYGFSVTDKFVNPYTVFYEFLRIVTRKLLFRGRRKGGGNYRRKISLFSPFPQRKFTNPTEKYSRFS